MRSYKLVNSLFEFFKESDLLIAYLGDFSDRSLLSFTDIIHIYDDKTGSFGSIKSKIIYLVIEAFQNVIRYSQADETNKFFCFKKMKEDYYITTANTIKEENVVKLKKNIDFLNSLGAEDLREKYKETLVNRDFSEKGGAGLGFIEMLRKTKQNIEYCFEKSSPFDDFFYFHIKYLTNSEAHLSLSDSRDLHKFLIANNILAFLKFQYDEKIVEAIARLTVDLVSRKHELMFHLIVEMIQNASIKNFSDSKDQVFMIQKNNEDYEITTEIIMNKSSIYEVDITLQRIKNLTKQELDDMYFDLIESDNNNLNNMLGFVEIARKAKEFNYLFVPISENQTMFVLNCIS